MFRRSRENLASWFTVSMGSVLIGFAGILYVLEAQDQQQAIDQQLYEVSQVMAASIEDGSYQDRRRVDLENVPLLGEEAAPLNTPLVYARWYSPERRLIQFYGAIPPAVLGERTGGKTAGFQTLPKTEQVPDRLRQLTLPVMEGNVLIGYLQVAAPLTPVEADLRQLRRLLAVTLLLTLGAIALIGWLLGALAMRPIRQAYDQLGQFTADASHELRAPLAAIVNHAQVGLMDLAYHQAHPAAPLDLQQQQARLEKILRGAESMGKLVGDLLLLARNQSQLTPAVLQQIDLVELLRPLIQDYRPQAVALGLQWQETLPPPPLVILAQPDLLRRAIANLLSNALQYTPAGGTVELIVQRRDRQALIQVRDTGIGIGPEDLSHLFERFYRADKVRSRSTGGFGLGLAIAEQIVQAHSGQITVQSQPQQGSSFQVALPLAPLGE